MNDTLIPLWREPERLESCLREIPVESGVYLMRDRHNNILYIGKSKKLRSRVRSYFRDSDNLSPRIALMVRQVVEIEFIVTDTEAEALALEANLIKQHQPYYNVLLKDDKKYPYICITWSEDYPRIFITRKRRLTEAKDRYYGPYVDSRSLGITLGIIKKVFPLRQRSQPLFKNRPCLNFDLGRCPGVCQQLISPEEYHQTMQKVASIFQGRSGELVETLEREMTEAATELNFELAAILRDRIEALKSLHAGQKVSLSDDTISRDAIALAADDKHCCIQLFQVRGGRLVGRLGFFADSQAGDHGSILQRVLEQHYDQVEGVEIPTEIIIQYELPEGEILADWLQKKKGRKVTLAVPKKQTKAELIAMVERNAYYELERTQKQDDRNLQALADLAEILDFAELPKRLECYDISHIQGSNAVASQVVFIDGVPAKQHYRHYKIKNPEVKIGHSDDFASMAEVIERRFKKYANIKDNSNIVNDENFPNLVVIDGGKGQLSAVVSILQQIDLFDKIKVIGLAKKKEEIFLPYRLQSLDTDPERAGVQLLRRLRDEAHRFAITFHRQQRLKQSRRSILEEVPGLGFQRQKQLLAHFHSIDYIREASLVQLQEVAGIGSALAEEIYNYFHSG
jgi:excinuclease ABC subunit C